MPTKSTRYVTNRLIPLFLGSARRKGANTDELIRRFGLPPNVEELPELRAKAETVSAVTAACAEAVGDPFLGMHIAESLPVGAYGLFEFVVRSCRTAREGFEQFSRYLSLVEDAVISRVNEVKGDAVLELKPPPEVSNLGRQVNEYILCVVVGSGRRIMQAPWHLKRVWFAHSAPADVKPLSTFFENAELEFDARSTGIRFPVEVMDRPFPTGDPALHAFLEEQARSRLPAPSTEGAIVPRVREKIMEILSRGTPQMERVAIAMHCSARTLQRRLDEAGTTFQELLDDVRHEQALVLLDDPRRSIAEVAFLLGYSDLGPFVRAFKRWTGKTPGEHRGQAAVVDPV